MRRLLSVALEGVLHKIKYYDQSVKSAEDITVENLSVE